MPPPNQNYVAIGRNTPSLTKFPIPPTIQNDLGMMASQTSKDVSGAYEELVNKAEDLKPQLDLVEDVKRRYIELMEASAKDFSQVDKGELEKIASSIEEATKTDSRRYKLTRDAQKIGGEIKQLYEEEQKRLEDMRSHIISKREEIKDLLQENPGLENVYRQHQDYAVGKSVQEKVKQMDPQDIMNKLQSSGQMKPQDLSNLMNLKPNQREDQLRQMMEQKELEKERQAQREEQEAARRAAEAERLRRNMHEKDLQKEVKDYIKQGRITPGEADPFLKGEQSREDFLNRFGPDLQAGHINAQVVTGGPTGGGVGGQGGGTGPGGPLVPGQGPIDVRVINDDNDPIPVTGGGGTGGGSGGGDPKAKPAAGDPKDAAEEFMKRQEIANILSGVTDLATPGGGALAQGLVQGVGALGTNAALRGGVVSAAGMLGIPGAAATGGLMAAGIGGKTWYEGAQYQREQERQFGTEQGQGPLDILNSPMFGAQVSSRLSNLMLAGEEIDALTEAMSELGSTSEETAEALGPASEALNRYRVLTPELAGAAATEGQRFGSPIGGAESLVLGRNMQEVAGRGFSAPHLREAAQAGNEAFQELGLPGGAQTAMAMANAFSSSRDPRNDLTLQRAGVTQQSIQAGTQALNDPLGQGSLLGIAAGVDISTIDPTTPQGRVDVGMLLPQAIAENIDINSYVTDEDGRIDREANLYRAGMDAETISGLTGQQISPQALMAQLDTMNEANTKRGTTGVRGLRQEAEVSLRREENIRQTQLDAQTGTTQGRSQGSWAGLAIDPFTIKYDEEGNPVEETFDGYDDEGNPIYVAGERESSAAYWGRQIGGFAADITGLDPLGTSARSNMDKGVSGTMDLSTNAMFSQEEGNVLGAIASGNVDPTNVTVTGGMSLEEARQDPTMREKLLNDEAVIEMGDKTITASELSKGLHDASISYDRGFLGIGGGLQETGGEDGSTGKIDLTDRAAEYFEIVGQGNSTDPSRQSGQITNTQDNYKAGTGQMPEYDKGHSVAGA